MSVTAQKKNKQKGAILVISMIMIAVLTSIGAASLAKSMSEVKAVKASRRMFATARKNSLKELNTMVAHKQRVTIPASATSPPYLKRKRIDLISVGNVTLALNGIPILKNDDSFSAGAVPPPLTKGFTTIFCLGNDIAAGQRYVIPSMYSHTFNNLPDDNYVSMFIVLDEMRLPRPANRGGVCSASDFPDHFVRANTFKGSITNLADGGGPTILSANEMINDVHDLTGPTGWDDFVNSTNSLLVANSELSTLRTDANYINLTLTLNAPWISETP